MTYSMEQEHGTLEPFQTGTKTLLRHITPIVHIKFSFRIPG